MQKQRFFYYFLAVFITLFSLLNRDLSPVNELKYISIALEGLRSNHWFAFYNHGDAYADKPPVYFWIIMLGIKLFGTEGGILWTGLFSVLPAIGICEVLYRWSKNDLNEEMRLLAIMLLMSTSLFLVCALILRMDMLMALFITLSLYQFHLAYQQQRATKQRYLILLFILCALFVKGPVGLLLPILSIVLFLFQKKVLKSFFVYFPVKGILAFIVVCGVWLWAVYLEGGKQYLYDLTVGQAVRRGVNASVHPEPIYYYLKEFLIVLQPWSLLYFAAIVSVFKTKEKVSDTMRLLITISVTGLVMLSLVSSKLEIYLLPLVPFISFACVIQLSRIKQEKNWKWGLYPIAITAFLLPIAVLLSGKGVATLPLSFFDEMVLFTIISVTGLITLLCLIKNNPISAVRYTCIGMSLLLFAVAMFIPRYNDLIGMRKVAEVAQAQSQQHDNSTIYAYRYRLASNLDVYLQKTINQLDSEQSILQLKPGSIIITKRNKADILKALVDNGQVMMAQQNIGKYSIFVR